MHVVFLTRKFPPQTGGMETFSWQLTQHWKGDHTVVARGKYQRDILWVAPVLLYHAMRLRKSADVFHLGDAVLAPLAPFIRFFTRKPVIVTVHGLELTFSKAGALYHTLIDWGLRSVNHCVCVSRATADVLQQRGFPSAHTTVIPHGVVPPAAINRTEARSAISRMLHINSDTLNTHYVLLTVGRLVKRKGVAWFIENVLPAIADLNPLYLITSTGPETEHIRALIKQHHLTSVHLLGTVSEDTLHQLYTAADVFVMPNIHIPNDMEGFGFVPVEAAAHGAPVVASKLEGIIDAIHDQKNGMLYAQGDASACVGLLRAWHDHPETRTEFGSKAKTYTLQHFRWDDVTMRYANLFERILSSHT